MVWMLFFIEKFQISFRFLHIFVSKNSSYFVTVFQITNSVIFYYLKSKINFQYMSIAKQNSLIFLPILFLIFSSVNCIDILPKSFQILTSPVITDAGIAQNISICFADCDSCQQTSGDCETCFAPWFQLSSGSCQLAQPTYILQSTQEEQRFQNFIASSEWLYNGVPVSSRVCTPNPQAFTRNITAIGPFGNGNVTYQRTISQHDYFSIKFLLILASWTTNATNLQITVTNQNGIVLSNQQISLQSLSIRNSYLEQLCSGSALDRRVSIILQISQHDSNIINMQFVGTMQNGATWSLSSFVLITGSCNPSCAACSGYTPSLSGCDICKNFLANNDTSGGLKCSICMNGFAFQSAQNICQKCPIQYKECRPNDVVCEFSNISNTSTDCKLANANYFDDKQLTDTIFYGSLYSIQSKGSATIQCGQYSLVGPANFGDIISRTFVQLPPHIAISINFNLFIFDQEQRNQRYTIVIIIDGQPMQFGQGDETINITASSNECNLRQNVIKFDTMKTFETSTFIPHKKRQNVVIGISLGTSSISSNTQWGLRDIRLVFRRCDENCQICTENGCQKCKGFLQLNDLQCNTCLIGTGLTANGLACLPCPQNCLRCNITGGVIVCTQCASGFYLYQLKNVTTCEINPTYGPATPSRINTNGGCVVTIPGNSNQTLSFDLGTNRAFMVVNTPAGTYKKNIQFHLIKLDNWQGDYLDIYINDLLVKRHQFYGSGSTYCGIENENDEIILQQFDLSDDNTTVTLELQAVQKDTSKARRFGVANFRVYPVGCMDCKNYDFIYSTKYNYDQRLFVQMAFNLVYQNNNPEDFKNIFRLKVGDKYYNYDVVANDSIRYWLQSERMTSGEILGQNVSVQCKYPLRVVSNIPVSGVNPGPTYINQYQFFERRVLQVVNNNSYMNAKTLDSNLASVWVNRFSPLLHRQSSVNGLQTFFSILTRIVIYVGFASFFIGCQTPCTHVMHNFQKLWVHIYVASLALSPIFKTVLWGFRESQDQNIAINPDQWQAGLPKYLYYETPAQYQQYYKDITFFRHIYNVGVAFAILILVFVVFNCIFRRFKKSQNLLIRHMKVTFVHRPLFYFNSIIFYQYFTVVLACCLQFLDLKTRTNEPTFAGLNAAACIIAFIFATIYPIVIHIILHRKRSTVLGLLQTIMTNNRNKQFQNHLNDLADLQEEQVIYNNKYSQIFYRFLPKQLWNANLADSEMISQKHFFYNIFRFGDLWWHAIVVILLYYAPFGQAFLLVLTNGFHLALTTFSKLNTNKYFRIFKSLELVFFMVIEILIIVMASLLDTLRFQSYQTLGIVAVIFVFFILLITFARFFYTLFKIYQEYRLTREVDTRGVVRRDAGFKRGWTQDYRIN